MSRKPADEEHDALDLSLQRLQRARNELQDCKHRSVSWLYESMAAKSIENAVSALDRNATHQEIAQAACTAREVSCREIWGLARLGEEGARAEVDRLVEEHNALVLRSRETTQ